ncbi:hypothetical protein VIGAN_01006600 [Vigna angularis var. angularis]|uniref:Uncharacterized protein n=1 Tax=Vigna angularis var. angularis TaxID=157739 RepID=A0A0S3QWC3_PHAAN|nr:hypothetical protein VIGAN_01006600 [Vigna angularis var. angularis]
MNLSDSKYGLRGAPNESGDGGGMSWVLVVNYSELAYRMNKLENKNGCFESSTFAISSKPNLCP